MEHFVVSKFVTASNLPILRTYMHIEYHKPCSGHLGSASVQGKKKKICPHDGWGLMSCDYILSCGCLPAPLKRSEHSTEPRHGSEATLTAASVL